MTLILFYHLFIQMIMVHIFLADIKLVAVREQYVSYSSASMQVAIDRLFMYTQTNNVNFTLLCLIMQ